MLDLQVEAALRRPLILGVCPDMRIGPGYSLLEITNGFQVQSRVAGG